jgi:hypothetical protein
MPMKNSVLSYMVDETLYAMFVTDKRGVLFFFPWGNRKKGYLLKNKYLKPKIKKFFSVSTIIYFIAIVLSFSLKHDVGFIFGGVFACTSGWLLVWYFYAQKITKPLPASGASYSEIILEKLSSDSDESENIKISE